MRSYSLNAVLLAVVPFFFFCPALVAADQMQKAACYVHVHELCSIPNTGIPLPRKSHASSCIPSC